MTICLWVPFPHSRYSAKLANLMLAMIKRVERDDDTVTVGKASVKKAPKKRVPGLYKGEFELSSAFFEPLPPEEVARWE
jgi:hypothetical protein